LGYREEKEQKENKQNDSERALKRIESIKFINEKESGKSYKYKEDWGCENNL